jgi:hypothetical protein
MNDKHRLTEVVVSTNSTEPRTGTVQLRAAKAEMEFEITEDLAHRICIELERFLTR